jgi:phosphatidylserine decarboxylase
VSPVDGTIGAFGDISGETLLQAKGKAYTLTELLEDHEAAQRYQGGHYLTIYLAPYNYHRIHSLLDGQVTDFAYIPGELWTVSPLGLLYVPKLFARNERWISYLQHQHREYALVKVGATVVGRIRVKYHERISNCPRALPLHQRLPTPHAVAKGEEIGRFELGSTVVVLFQKGTIEWNALSVGQTVKLGEQIATLNRHSP